MRSLHERSFDFALELLNPSMVRHKMPERTVKAPLFLGIDVHAPRSQASQFQQWLLVHSSGLLLRDTVI